MQKVYHLLFIIFFLLGTSLGIQAQTNLQDSLALVDLYNSTGGNNWTTKTNWLSQQPVSNWYGVTVANGRVVAITSYYNYLNGTLPGTLGNLSNLHKLALGGNLLKGLIPDSLGNLSNLDTLDLTGNRLSGNIPASLGQLSKLRLLYLSSNQLTGSIPLSFQHLDSIRQLLLNSNQLTDSIPAALYNFPNLIAFYTALNHFTFAGVEGMIKAYKNGLIYANQYNIPLHRQGNMLYVSVGGTPANNTYKWYQNNTLIATNVGDSTLTITSEGNYSVDVTNSIAISLKLHSYDSVIQKDSLALVDFYNSTNGTNWFSISNWCTNQPISKWFGITAVNGSVLKIDLSQNNLSGTLPSTLGQLTNLTRLMMTFNNVGGALPQSIGNLTSLAYFNAIGNKLSDTIPASIGNLGNLAYLGLAANQLRGPIPSSMGNLSSLDSLYLGGNAITGNIPSSFSNLSNLVFMNLNSDSLTGVIPKFLGSLTSLKYLGIGFNQFSGEIPSELGNLGNLQYLIVDRNKLTGQIPASLGNLSNLIWLGLSENQLSGSIPASLNNLSKLQQYSIAFNNFTFAGMEYFVSAGKNGYYSPQNNIPIRQSGNRLSISVGGTQNNVTYTWYKDGQIISTKSADSTLVIISHGSYNVTAYDNNIYGLTLRSDTSLKNVINAILPDKVDLLYANLEYTDPTGWTHYYFNNNTPQDISDDTLLISLKKNGQNIGTIGDGTFAVKLAATANAGTNTGLLITNPLINNTSGYWVMNRFWQVTPTQQPSASVGVRFYYNNQDVADVNGSYPLHNLGKDKLIFYKATGGNPDPTTNLTGAIKLTGILPNTYASDTTWTFRSVSDSTQYAEYSVSSFSGGGGGATGDGKTITTSAATILPVTLLDFSGNRQGNINLLQWATTNEMGIKTFEVETSANGNSFLSIGKEAAKDGGKYLFKDINPFSVRSYYRLKMIDSDGRFTYSSIIWINTVTTKDMNVYPNPVAQATSLNIGDNLDLIGTHAQLTDANGRIIKQIAISHSFEQLDMSNLSAGLYCLMFKNGGVIKIIKE